MQYVSVVLKNKSLMDCWVYVGAIDVYYLLAKYKLKIRVAEGENIYVVSSHQNIKNLGVVKPETKQLNIIF
jgi:hypothetical protein